MAYKQSPGRMNMPKTGRGLSPNLMSKSPMKQETEPELTARGSTLRDKALKTVPKRAANKKDPQGIQIDPKTGTASAKPYEKKFIGGKAESSNKKVPTGSRTNAMIVDKAGKKVKEADTYKGKTNEALYAEYKKDSTDTMSSRNRNARLFNVQTGKAKDITSKEVESGKNRGFYKK